MVNRNKATSFADDRTWHLVVQDAAKRATAVVIDSALDQSWGSTATTTVTRTFPSGTQIFEGAAAPQGGLVGGGNQIYIPQPLP